MVLMSADIPPEFLERKIRLGMSWRKLIELGMDAPDRNERLNKLVELIDKQAREIEKYQNLIKLKNSVEVE